MKYFVTGATGFLGGALVRQLRQFNHEVIALVRDSSKAEELKRMGLSLVTGDITDRESMREAMRGCDGVFHLAAWYKLGAKDISPARKINVGGTLNVFELARELGIPKVVYTSTIAVNSDTKGTSPDENYRYSGEHISEYDRTKAAAHEMALNFIQSGLPLVILMPGLIYGPNGSSMSDEALRLYLKKQLPLIPLKAAYCWSHVDDVAEIHNKAMNIAKPGTTYMVCGPKHTLVEAFQIAKSITGIRTPIAVPPAMLRLTAFLASMVEGFLPLPEMYRSESLRVQAGVTYLGDNSKAKTELGYNPRILELGLRQTLQFEQALLQNSTKQSG